MAPKISQYYDYKIGEKDYKLRFRTPTVGQQIAIGQNLAAYKAGFSQLDKTSETLAYATATLNMVIMDKPVELNFENLDTDDWAEFTKMLTDYEQFAFFRNEAPAKTSPS